MFIEIRKAGKKKKYYLAHTFREGRKIRKAVRYLGADLSKKKLEELRKRAEVLIKEQIKSYKEIRDPFRNILSTDELNQLKSLNIKTTIKVSHLSEKDWLDFAEKFTYNTNAIEGSRITYTQVKDIIEKQKWPKFSSKEEVSETYGVVDAVKFIRETKEHIPINLIKKIHGVVFRNSKPFSGEIRQKGIEVVVADRQGNVIHRGAPSEKLISLLKELVNWYNKNKDKYPPIVLAAVVHNQFEEIHPFQDGNGRVGRLLLNNILIKHNLPPVNIQLKNREEYYNALQEYHKSSNIKPMIDLILKEYK
ncbi:Fic family protein [Candidatus Woesearchaeota archaeon]|nr:Fic family protein [Candidatus Woesearchaeota archaeon]